MNVFYVGSWGIKTTLLWLNGCPTRLQLARMIGASLYHQSAVSMFESRQTKALSPDRK